MLTINTLRLNDEKDLIFKYNMQDEDNVLQIFLDKTYEEGAELTLNVNYNTNYENQSDPNNIWGSFGKGIRFFEPSFTEKG